MKLVENIHKIMKLEGQRRDLLFIKKISHDYSNNENRGINTQIIV